MSLIADEPPRHYGGHGSGILSIRGPEQSPGVVRVGTASMVNRLHRMRGRFPAYLGSVSHRCGPLHHDTWQFCFQSSRTVASAHAVQATTRPQAYP